MTQGKTIVLDFARLIEMGWGPHLFSDHGWQQVPPGHYHTIWIIPAGIEDVEAITVSAFVGQGRITLTEGESITISSHEEFEGRFSIKKTGT
jgi:hypothetical protein